MTPQDVAAELVADPASAGLVLDFDGTLAPIVDDPATSALPDGVGDTIEAIAQRLGVVAIVSGRPASFLGDRALLVGVRLLGLYGTEEWRGDRAVPREEALRWQPALDEARDRLALGLAGHPGVLLEDKGLAVALHWRNAEDRAGAERFVADLVADVAADTGLALQPGKFVAELRPPLDWDKGTAVEALVSEHRLSRVVYVGDDRGDLPGFAAAQAAGGRALVVEHGAETPDEVRAAADGVINGANGVAEWLGALAQQL